MGEDPVKEGIVTRLDRPGGNITGFSNFTNRLFSKRLGLLLDIVPRAEVLAFVVNPNNPNADDDTTDVQAAAAAAGRRLEVLRAGSERELQMAFADMVQKQVGGLIVGVDPPFFGVRRALIAVLAIRHAIPAIYDVRAFPDAGGLMSYARNPAIFQSNCRPSSSWSSISTPPRRSASPSPKRCWRRPTRLSSSAPRNAKNLDRRCLQGVRSGSAEQSAAVLMHGRCTSVSGPVRPGHAAT